MPRVSHWLSSFISMMVASLQCPLHVSTNCCICCATFGAVISHAASIPTTSWWQADLQKRGSVTSTLPHCPDTAVTSHTPEEAGGETPITTVVGVAGVQEAVCTLQLSGQSAGQSAGAPESDSCIWEAVSASRETWKPPDEESPMTSGCRGASTRRSR